MKLNKIFLTFVGMGVFFYSTTWVFNHVSPWVSVLMIIGAIAYGLHRIDKNSNNQNQ
jgi:hypothetical protein